MGLNTMVRRERELNSLIKRFLAGDKSCVKIVVDDGLVGIIPGLRELGYSDIITFPPHTPFKRKCEILAKMPKASVNDPLLLVTQTYNFIDWVYRPISRNYSVLFVSKKFPMAKIPMKMDSIFHRDRRALQCGFAMNIIWEK